MKHLICAACAAAAACAAPVGTTQPAPPAAVAQQQEMQLAEGRQVFEAVCATCHTIDPPPKTAPPMSHIARHYRMAEPDSGRAIARIAEWVNAPSADKSLLPAHAVQRFGLMPALQLTDAQAAAVAAYVVSLGEPQRGMHRGGRRH